LENSWLNGARKGFYEEIEIFRKPNFINFLNGAAAGISLKNLVHQHG
jgi:hypothetical protein